MKNFRYTGEGVFMRNKIFGVVVFGSFVFSSLPARAEIIKFECTVPGNMKHLVEIDSGRKQATFWTVVSPTVTNGPSGPYPATQNSERVLFSNTTTVGKSSSTSKYTMDLKKQTFRIDITYNYDQDPWTRTEPCKRI
jgi:hypothetical protein